MAPQGRDYNEPAAAQHKASTGSSRPGKRRSAGHPEESTVGSVDTPSGSDAVSGGGRRTKQQKTVVSPAWKSSKFRGVTKHRRSGRWEAHIWVGKGINKQIYLGGFAREEVAAEAYDMAAMKTKGFAAATNFSQDRYKDVAASIESSSMEEVVTAVRRGSQGFSRGTSTFRGVTPHPSGRFEARIGIAGSKHIYLGLFSAESEAARSYDRAVVRIKGLQASTNFHLSDYSTQVTEHELKHLEINKPDAFHALCSHATAALKREDLLLPDCKIPNWTIHEASTQKWVRRGYPEQEFSSLEAVLMHVRGNPPMTTTVCPEHSATARHTINTTATATTSQPASPRTVSTEAVKSSSIGDTPALGKLHIHHAMSAGRFTTATPKSVAPASLQCSLSSGQMFTATAGGTCGTLSAGSSSEAPTVACQHATGVQQQPILANSSIFPTSATAGQCVSRRSSTSSCLPLSRLSSSSDSTMAARHSCSAAATSTVATGMHTGAAASTTANQRLSILPLTNNRQRASTSVSSDWSKQQAITWLCPLRSESSTGEDLGSPYVESCMPSMHGAADRSAGAFSAVNREPEHLLQPESVLAQRIDSLVHPTASERHSACQEVPRAGTFILPVGSVRPAARDFIEIHGRGMQSTPHSVPQQATSVPAHALRAQQSWPVNTAVTTQVPIGGNGPWDRSQHSMPGSLFSWSGYQPQLSTIEQAGMLCNRPAAAVNAGHGGADLNYINFLLALQQVLPRLEGEAEHPRDSKSGGSLSAQHSALDAGATAAAAAQLRTPVIARPP